MRRNRHPVEVIRFLAIPDGKVLHTFPEIALVSRPARPAIETSTMRTEVESIVRDIEQAIALLRRHL
jgi:hypothetical protein